MTDQISCSVGVLALFECWNIVGKPENLGWWQVLQGIEKQRDFYPGKIALIVDSDLGLHDQFNGREIPIFADFFLPSYVTLVYASDKGNPNHLSTKMIAYCDSIPRLAMRPEWLLLWKEGLAKTNKDEYSHFRQWDTKSINIKPFLGVDISSF
jgi:hypothetical protein